MKIIVQPQKSLYKLLFIDGRRMTAVGRVNLSPTLKGRRPENFRLKKGRGGQMKPTPTKDFISLLRKSDVRLTGSDEAFESFLQDMQIRWHLIRLCRFCLLGDRITPLEDGQGVRYGREEICYECAKRELRREMGYLGKFGKSSLRHVERLLGDLRDLDRVLASLQPESVKTSRTLYDRLEASGQMKTACIRDLPLPPEFVERCGVEHLMPVQQIAVDAGLLERKDLLVVSATASGKTFIGEMAGLKNYLEGQGGVLFLVPLVALANQKYQRFRETYGGIMKVALHTGVSRVRLPETRAVGVRDLNAPLVVGTYEGIDHALRCGRSLKKISTVVIDEVQMLEDPERGHRLDGLIARLKYLFPDAQFLYLSATIGAPGILAEKLHAGLVRYADRPVPLERHLIFTERKQKIPYIKQMVTDAFREVSSKGYHGQTIVFTNSRARCHTIADALGRKAAAYHAGLTAQERRDVERRFEKGELAAVVTTAALAAGVDFPASLVIFDALAMGIQWLSVQEFYQMLGRAGRPDFHDLGKVVILAEPGGSYSRDSTHTEDEVAVRLLKGEMEEVAPDYDIEGSSEEFVANAVVCGGDEGAIIRMNQVMVGTLEPVLGALLDHHLVHRKGVRAPHPGEGRASRRIELTSLARVMAEHFIGMERLLELRRLVRKMDDPIGIIAELEVSDLRDAREPQKQKSR